VKAPERHEHARGEVVQRDVVVARDRQPRERQRVEQRARGEELPLLGSVGQVAAEDDEIRPDLGQRGGQRGERRRIRAPEVRIGYVGERPQNVRDF
jgi:hypothetical protein